MELAPAVTLYQLSVAVHVMAVVLAFGATFAFPIIQITAERAFPTALPFAWTTIHQISRKMVTPAAVLVGITGIYQALDGPFEFGQDQWMELGLLGWLIMMGLGTGFLEPKAKQAAAAAARMVEQAGPDGEVTLSDEYRAINKLPNVIAPALALLVLSVIYLMEVKPFTG